MKYYSTLLILLTAILITGCNTEELENRIVELEAELDSVTSLQTKKDSAVRNANTSFDKIDSNLTEIQTLESELRTELNKGKKSDNKKVKNLIDLIQKSLEENQIYLEDIEIDSADAEDGITALMQSAVKGVSQRIMSNNIRMANLNHDLNSLGDDYVILFDEYLEVNLEKWNVEDDLARKERSVKNLETRLKEMDNYLNTAYYIIGTKRDLIDKGILENGGLMRRRDLNEDLDRMAFEPIDIREIEEISLGKGKIEVITEHPHNSYSIKERNGESYLNVEIPKEFWSISKYLVVIRS